MLQWTVISPTQPDELEVAAIAAALAALSGAEAPAAGEQADAGAPGAPGRAWEASGKLSQQGLLPARTGVAPRWNTIERLQQRAAGGFSGIVGL